ncbi:Hypp6676 [Branchiostoma lanceolatum]|uniref:Hypp6676 protein n=1 Tax=Branchiostoma lanceolatum TaxID=7740 RepID=A0A8K0E5H1_BRALA|nr:Hypp6676 [Branchiostoma lanceolatum]
MGTSSVAANATSAAASPLMRLDQDPLVYLANNTGHWYCSPDCVRGAQSEDNVQNYTKALMWEGMCHMARRDSVREGDGPAIVDMWKFDMVSFWTKKHFKYFIIAHQMLTGVGEFLPARLRHNLVWNRVGNVRGGAGRNVGLDLINEFLNNDFKEMLKHSRGQYTDKQVQRVSEMSGSFGRLLDRLFPQAGPGSMTYGSTFSHDGRYAADIAKFVKEFKGDGLFEYLPGRSHGGFDNFHYKTGIQNVEKMGAKIRKLAQDMDLWARLSYNPRKDPFVS